MSEDRENELRYASEKLAQEQERLQAEIYALVRARAPKNAEEKKQRANDFMRDLLRRAE